MRGGGDAAIEVSLTLTFRWLLNRKNTVRVSSENFFAYRYQTAPVIKYPQGCPTPNLSVIKMGTIYYKVQDIFFLVSGSGVRDPYSVPGNSVVNSNSKNHLFQIQIHKRIES
jgi:hypothetical protein